jgi:hypothetical protein
MFNVLLDCLIMPKLWVKRHDPQNNDMKIELEFRCNKLKSRHAAT